MIPLIDMHCHLLAGLDDGPATQEEALAMCRLAYAEGTRMAAAYRQVRQWAGHAVADRVCSTFGMAILQGLPLRTPQPEPRRRAWLAKFW